MTTQRSTKHSGSFLFSPFNITDLAIYFEFVQNEQAADKETQKQRDNKQAKHKERVFFVAILLSSMFYFRSPNISKQVK